MSINPEVFCHEWNAAEFYHLVRYHAWEAHAEREYSRLMAAKK